MYYKCVLIEKNYRNSFAAVILFWFKNAFQRFYGYMLYIGVKNLLHSLQILGLVVQSIVSLTSSLRDQLVKFFRTL